MNVTLRGKPVTLANPTYQLEYPAPGPGDPSGISHAEGELKDGANFPLPAGGKLTLYFDDPKDSFTPKDSNEGILEDLYFGWASNLAPESNEGNKKFKESETLDVHNMGNQFVNGENKTVFEVKAKKPFPGEEKIEFGIVISGQWHLGPVQPGSKVAVAVNTPQL